MKRNLQLVAILFAVFLTACSTSYKVAPSTSAVSDRVSAIKEHVSTAQALSKVQRNRLAETQASTKMAMDSALRVGETIVAARAALKLQDYGKVDELLIRALSEQSALVATNRNLQTQLNNWKDYYDAMDSQLQYAQDEVGKTKEEVKVLQGKIDKAATDAADDHYIAERCKSYFGLGAIFYGIERLLHAGIWGILILVVVVIVLIAIGGPVGMFLLGLIRKIFKL